MNETNARGSNLAKVSLSFALIALLAPPIISPLLMIAMLPGNRPLPFGQVFISALFILTPICGLVAAICGHIARRRLDVTRAPQKSAIALAGLIIGYAVIVQSLSGQIVARLYSLGMRGM